MRTMTNDTPTPPPHPIRKNTNKSKFKPVSSGIICKTLKITSYFGIKIYGHIIMYNQEGEITSVIHITPVATEDNLLTGVAELVSDGENKRKDNDSNNKNF